MGEYHRFVNLDKRQYFSGHALNLSGKFTAAQGEFFGGMLVFVLARTAHLRQPPLQGAWAGDRITVAGDEGDARALYDRCDDEPGWTDISVPLAEQWIDEDVFRSMEHWQAGLIEDDGRFVLDGARRQELHDLRKDAEFPFEEWERRRQQC